MFYLMTHSTHFIYGYMALGIGKGPFTAAAMWASFQSAAWDLLYAPSHKQDSTYHGLFYTSCGALAGTINTSVGPP